MYISKIPEAGKTGNIHTLDFRGIPEYYRGLVKQYEARLIVRRSYSHCYEKLVYIRYFFRVFYENGVNNQNTYDGMMGAICKGFNIKTNDYGTEKLLLLR